MFIDARPTAHRSTYHRFASGKFALSALGTAALLALAPPATAQAAKEGKIDFTFSADVTDISKISGPETQEVSVFEANLVITATASGPMERMGGRCLGFGGSDTGTQEWHGQGSCVWQDAEGDKIFDTIEDTGSGGVGAGTGKFVGGTGKFAGITGSHEYRLEFIASPREGATQWVGHKTGIWRILTN